MTLKLGGRGVQFLHPTRTEHQILRVTDRPDRIAPCRASEAFLVRATSVPSGFGYYLCFPGTDPSSVGNENAPVAVLPDEYRYLSDGDIIRLMPDQASVRVLFRRSSPHNSFLLTERCNHYCLMCSQPPRDVDDSWIIDEILETLPLGDQDTVEIGFTGGEPTLLGDDLLRILLTAKNLLPRTAVHILSNGRRFADIEYARRYADVAHPDMMVGIPIYSDVSTIHDYVVQADGAFDETIRGILNLKRFRQRVEVRIVIHKQTFRRLPQLAAFLARNLTFVDHVALMGLEMMGFVKANLNDLWVDPVEYQDELHEAATHLASSGMTVSIYNHQLCLLDRRLWPFARKSISDWKNVYMPECQGCTSRDACGGFFASATLRYSDHIKPFD